MREERELSGVMDNDAMTFWDLVLDQSSVLFKQRLGGFSCYICDRVHWPSRYGMLDGSFGLQQAAVVCLSDRCANPSKSASQGTFLFPEERISAP